jgi:hypothetical protein
MIQLSNLRLDQEKKLRRNLPQPIPQGHDGSHDTVTVFYDCFRSEDGARVVFVGPPLNNFETPCLGALRDAFEIEDKAHPIARTSDRHSYVWLNSPRDSAEFAGNLFEQRRISVQPNHSNLFRGRRVLVTLSKDNPLIWIRDWAHFFAKKHGCDAVLFYDNSSTAYGTGEIQEVIRSVSGIEVAIVIDWPFQFGMTGYSNFSEFGILEHARRRFLASADVVINADIDELVVTCDGRSVCDLTQESRTGYLHYDGRWIENATFLRDNSTRRHKDYIHFSKTEKAYLPKWTVVPNRCPENSDWRVHVIDGMEADAIESKKVLYRHFKAMNTNWRMERWRSESPADGDYLIDRELSDWLQVYDEQLEQLSRTG